MNEFAKLFFCIILFIFSTKDLIAQNAWILDRELTEIKFILPLLVVGNIEGQFSKFNGSVVIDPNNKENNRALFSVEIKSMELNYNKYKELLLSEIFFNEFFFPIALIDTKKFTAPETSNSLEINAELQIKDIVHSIPIIIEINYLTNDFLQVKTNFEFSRTSYDLGKRKWPSTILLQDKIIIQANIFLIRE